MTASSQRSIASRRNSEEDNEDRRSVSIIGGSCSSSSSTASSRAEEKHETKQRKKMAGSMDLLQVTFFPSFNVLVTVVLIAVLVYIYDQADGQDAETYRIAGMRVPTILALIMSLAVMFIAGGVGFALSEYKWVHFQRHTSSLSLLDAYDGTSRGFGGAIRALPALGFSVVLIPGILIQLLSIAMAPAAQEVLQIGTTQQCSPDSSGNLPSTDFRTDDYTTFSSATLDPRSIHGIYNDFMVRYAFQHAKSGLPIQANAACPNNAYCTYSNIAIPHTTAECTAGSLDTPIMDIHANNVTTLRQYWAKDISNVFTTFIDDAPRVFYEGSMAGRTFYDLKNLTLTRLQNNTYNTAIRNMFGD